ncbi:MAG: hypothetical protein CMK49_03800 [Prochlorococcus sp. SP3034]|nr:hypothetical protein [Prochlorococcus sp. SP3034]|tara:strand:- start:3614 stop:4567 length:954 start_codon:yes stop_codon:yes gene_type:complete
MKFTEIINDAKKILESEANSIKNFSSNIDEEFVKAVEIISKCNGKIFITGVGKSGLIANKISSTFSSLGTPSMVIDPLDALHGDLGMIEKDDLIIIISNSGESNELIKMISFLHKKDILIISITNDEKSRIAKSANININSHCRREANELGFIPTCSTTTSLAIGDALALTIAKFKGHKLSDYAEIHPSGKIGECLCMKVKKIMRKDNLPICNENTKIEELLELIENCSLGSAFITKNNKLSGIITDGDIRRKLYYYCKDKIIAKDIMTKNPKTITPDDEVFKAIDKMYSYKINTLPVTLSDEVVGAIQLYDINFSK